MSAPSGAPAAPFFRLKSPAGGARAIRGDQRRAGRGLRGACGRWERRARGGVRARGRAEGWGGRRGRGPVRCSLAQQAMSCGQQQNRNELWIGPTSQPWMPKGQNGQTAAQHLGVHSSCARHTSQHGLQQPQMPRHLVTQHSGGQPLQHHSGHLAVQHSGGHVKQIGGQITLQQPGGHLRATRGEGESRGGGRRDARGGEGRAGAGWRRGCVRRAVEALRVAARALDLAEVDAARRRALRAVAPLRAALAVCGAADAGGRGLEVLAAAAEEVLARERDGRGVDNDGGSTPVVVGVRHFCFVVWSVQTMAPRRRYSGERA